MAEEKKVLLEVTGLKQYFNVGRKDEVKAIDDISFHIYEVLTTKIDFFCKFAY